MIHHVHPVDEPPTTVEVQPPPRPRYSAAEIRAAVHAALLKSQELKETLRMLNEAIKEDQHDDAANGTSGG